MPPLVGPQPGVQLRDEFGGKMPAFADGSLNVGKWGAGYIGGFGLPGFLSRVRSVGILFGNELLIENPRQAHPFNY